MTPAQSPCDRLMIGTVALIVLAALTIAGALEFTGHAGASAAFIGVSVAALGILSPSPLKQHSTPGTQSVEAPSATTVTMTQTPAAEPPAVVPAEEGQAP